MALRPAARAKSRAGTGTGATPGPFLAAINAAADEIVPD